MGCDFASDPPSIKCGERAGCFEFTCISSLARLLDFPLRDINALLPFSQSQTEVCKQLGVVSTPQFSLFSSLHVLLEKCALIILTRYCSPLVFCLFLSILRLGDILFAFILSFIEMWRPERAAVLYTRPVSEMNLQWLFGIPDCRNPYIRQCRGAISLWLGESGAALLGRRVCLREILLSL